MSKVADAMRSQDGAVILFSRKPYVIRRKRHCVYVRWRKRIEEWSGRDCEEYGARLRDAVGRTVDQQTWSLLIDGPAPRADDPEYRRYVESVLTRLIAEYGLDTGKDEVRIGLYHGGVLVISFIGKEGETYPYYYCGVQLKPRHRDGTQPGARG